ncbi:hypothetical protein K9L05_02080 [Candidatus Babeliales bacterium]|nr:hypothetical protein [Candidatus Babeliales bacterium]MCF7899417.1 hypothetical protein [Candidatus Babeliales bacterium]
MNFYNFFNKTLIFSFLLFFVNNIFCMEPTPEEIRELQIEAARSKADMELNPNENLIFAPIEKIKPGEYLQIIKGQDQRIKVGDDVYYYSQSQDKIEKVKIENFLRDGGILVIDSKGLKRKIPYFNVLGKVSQLTLEELEQRSQSKIKSELEQARQAQLFIPETRRPQALEQAPTISRQPKKQSWGGYVGAFFKRSKDPVQNIVRQIKQLTPEQKKELQKLMPMQTTITTTTDIPQAPPIPQAPKIPVAPPLPRRIPTAPPVPASAVKATATTTTQAQPTLSLAEQLQAGAARLKKKQEEEENISAPATRTQPRVTAPTDLLEQIKEGVRLRKVKPIEQILKEQEEKESKQKLTLTGELAKLLKRRKKQMGETMGESTNY